MVYGIPKKPFFADDGLRSSLKPLSVPHLNIRRLHDFGGSAADTRETVVWGTTRTIGAGGCVIKLPCLPEI